MTGCCQVCTAVDSPEQANALATTLVGEHLAACVQVIGPIESVYRWKGAVEAAKEWLVVAKTTDTRRAELMARIGSLHPYELPEITALSITHASDAYLGWIARETTPEAR